MRRVGDLLCKPTSNARLADARLARDQDNLTVSRPCEQLALEQNGDLRLAANEATEPRRAGGLEAALRGGYAIDSPSLDWCCQPLDRLWSEIAERKTIPKQAAGCSCHDHRSRHRKSLQPGGQVRRVADDRLLSRAAFPKEIADDDDAGGDACARLQPLVGAGC